MTSPRGTLQHDVLQRAAEAVSDVEILAELGELEELKNTIAAAQARLAVRLREQRLAQRQHLPSSQRTCGVGAEIGLARRESPHRGGRHLALGWVLCRELPHTLAAMEAGRCSEWAATLVARSTACLSREDRRAVDEQLMAETATTQGWGEGRLAAEADALAYRLDPQAAVRRRARAVAERHVSLRPVPGVEGAGMTRLSALLPLEAGVATLAALGRAAELARNVGDPRTRGQVMADTLVDRVTGLTQSESGPTDGSQAGGPAPVVPIEVNVVVSDATLLDVEGGAGDQAGWVDGVPLPADTVRELVARAHAGGLATLRRLYATPSTGSLVAMDSRSRRFPAGLSRFLDRRDRTCRTPYCDAPIRHHDHLLAFCAGGATSASNGDGLCEGCNYARQAVESRPPPVPAPSSPAPLAPPSRFRVELQWHAA